LATSLKIGKYEVVDVIGEGGMGVVYKAIDPKIGCFVAIKMITSGFAGNPELLERFYREAKSTGSLRSPTS
jgi:eukaryotic-like serine/threonine-protein kinase